MLLTRSITCGNCGKAHRVHRRLETNTRYRFRCKRCGAEIYFGVTSVRWTCRPPETDGARDLSATVPGRAVPRRSPPPERPGSGQRPDDPNGSRVAVSEAPPPAPPPIPCKDTVADARVPVHLTPLVRRGVHHADRESSRVRWLRERLAAER